MVETTTLTCKVCTKPFQHPRQRGRKPNNCPSCRANPVEQPTSEEAFDLNPAEEPVESTTTKQVKKEGPATFEVIVNNVGSVYRGDDEDEAWKQFAVWVRKCSLGFGSCGYEATKFFQFGKLVKEVDPRKQWIEDHYPHLKDTATQP